MSVGNDEHRDADLHPFGGGRERGHERDWFENVLFPGVGEEAGRVVRVGRLAIEGQDDVIRYPDRIESEAFGVSGKIDAGEGATPCFRKAAEVIEEDTDLH